MSKFTNKNFFSSVKHAVTGVLITVKSQRNFRYQLILLLFLAALGVYLHFGPIEMCLVIFSVVLILASEMFNSVIEFSLDAMYRNKYSILVKMAKDISAGAVFFTSANCVIINSILFGSKFLNS